MKDGWIYTCEVKHEIGPYVVAALICSDGIRECPCGKPMIPLEVYEHMWLNKLGLLRKLSREEILKLYPRN